MHHSIEHLGYGWTREIWGLTSSYLIDTQVGILIFDITSKIH
jgi:hypothetical protein